MRLIGNGTVIRVLSVQLTTKESKTKKRGAKRSGILSKGSTIAPFVKRVSR
jgi:hypothetical protein